MTKVVILALLVALALIAVGCENLGEDEGLIEVENIENEIGDNGTEEEHVREVEFSEVDLSEPYWAGEMWIDMGADIDLTVDDTFDLSQFADQPIESREQAKIIAYEILEQHQRNGFLKKYLLWSIDHDPAQNIWIFLYLRDPVVAAGMPFYAAVDGYTSELLRMWVW